MMPASPTASTLKKTAWIFHGLCILLFFLWLALPNIAVAIAFYFFFAVGIVMLIADYSRAKAPVTVTSDSKAEVATMPQSLTTAVKPEMTELLNGRYEMGKQLRVGGMSVISLGSDRETGKPCVIKVPRYDTEHDSRINVEKLDIEASNLRRFDHPHIVKFIDYFTEDNIPHLVVEYIEGDDMLTAFAGKPADEARVLKWADQILDAVVYIHSNHVVHRDINPANIMLNKDEDIVIIDFGTIKPPAIAGATEVRKEGFEVPEQALGYADERSDIYGVGGTLFYLLTSRKPGNIGSYINKVDQLLEKDYSVSQRTAKCIAQALKMDAGSRFQSADIMRKALKD